MKGSKLAGKHSWQVLMMRNERMGPWRELMFGLSVLKGIERPC
jgi:hypothetical protein